MGSVEPLVFTLNNGAPTESEPRPVLGDYTGIPPGAAGEQPSEAEPLQMLSAMFPDIDNEIIEAVLHVQPPSPKRQKPPHCRLCHRPPDPPRRRARRG